MTNSAPSNSAGPMSGSRISTTHRLVEGEAIAGSSGMSYRPLLELGEGGMARIVLALATGPGGFNKLVVLKVMRAGQDTTEIRRLLLAEARLSARLNHPNVVQVQEVVEAAEDAPYLVMEYLDGRPLSALRISDTFTPGMLMTVISEALVGLHYAHELSDFDGTPLHIVHRDVSPHNVFLTYDGVVKVLDFGIAKMMHSDTSNTETGEVKGKLAYMAPEQLLGEKLDQRADIFAIGSMLWEAATGARMWANVSQANLMHRLISGDIPAPSSVASVDPELERIIVRATAARPEDRYESALAMHEDLDAYLEATDQRAVLREIGTALAEAYKSDRQERARAIKEALRHNSVPPPPSTQVDLTTESAPRLAPPNKKRALWLAPLLLVLLLAVLIFVARAWQRTLVAKEPAASPSTISPSTISPSTISPSTISSREPALTGSASPLAPSTEAAAPSATTEPHASRAKSAGFFAGSPAKHAATNAPLPAATSAAATAAPSADCNPPYFFDHGIKTYKPQCL